MRRPLLLLTLSLVACDGLALRPVPPTTGVRDAAADDAAAQPDAGPMDDAAPRDDAMTTPDAGALDAAPTDATALDSGTLDSGTPPMPCGFDVLPAADRDRVVLVGETFTPTPGVDGTMLRVLTLSTGGQLVPTDTRLDLGFRPARIEFVPSGELALVLGEDGELTTVRVRSPTDLTRGLVIQLPSAGFGDLRILPDGQTVIVAGSNVGATSGLSTVHVGCDGALTEDVGAFYNLRLAASLAFIDAAQTRAVVLGGQAVFAPVDADDLRIFERSNGQWRQVAAFDLWMDAIDALRIAVSPDGRTLLVPNGSPFSTQGGQVMVATIGGDVLSAPRLLPNMADAREAMFSADGATALITLLQGGAVVVLADNGAGFAEVSRIRGIGLAEQMAAVQRGGLAGRVLVTSVDAQGGPNIAQLAIGGPGVVRDLGQVELGMGSQNIPGAIAVQP